MGLIDLKMKYKHRKEVSEKKLNYKISKVSHGKG